jgi:hyperpolarization activated cyclic nucleotide-gated potassium channel 2
MNGDFQTLDFVVDLFFLVDIAITFNTAIVDHTTELLVLDRSEIVRRYLSFWFWIDLVASFPFDMVLRVSVFDKFTVFRVVRIIRTLRTLRVLKLLTDTSTMQRSKRLQSMNISVSVFHLLRFVLVVLLIAHILACAWIYIGQIGGSRGWISRSPFGSIEHYNELELYITAMYWVLVTMFSIGYGDFTPITELERSFTIGLQFVGGLTFGSILAEATRIVNTSNPHARVRNARMDQLRLYLMERNLPIKLKSDIKVSKHTVYAR